jgi:hypothetical protein
MRLLTDYSQSFGIKKPLSELKGSIMGWKTGFPDIPSKRTPIGTCTSTALSTGFSPGKTEIWEISK